MRRILLGALLLALLTTHLDAHGGQYKGPADAGSSGSAGQGGNNPPTNPGGAAAPGPGSPSRPGATSTTPTSYGRGEGRGQSDRKKSTTGASFEVETNYEIWEFWWENNKDRFLDLKERLIKTSNVSGSLGVLTGRGRKSQAGTSRRPSPEMIRTEVIPALRKLASTATDRDIIDSSVLALGRVARETDAASVIAAATPLLKHNELSVQTSATLALGVLASPEASPLLRDLLSDSSNGRQLLGGGEVPWLVRAFAALSLGLIGDDQAVSTLISVIGKLDDSDKDIKVCAIVGLALIKDEALKATAAADLEKRLDARNMDITVKSYIPTTLGKLGMRSSLKPVLDTFLDRDTNNLVRQSSAIGLGRLATIEDEDVIDALVKYAEEGSDMQTRHFSFVSLAKIGAKDQDRAAHAEAHEEILGLLTGEITKPDRQTNRSWAAVSAAIYGRAHTEAQPEIIDRLVDAYDKEKDPSFKASFAVALGLLNAQSAANQIYEDFMESKDYDFKGYAAVALGFLKHMDAADALRSRIQDKSTTPTFRLQAATGLGLMGDEQAVDVLIDTLQSAQTLGVSSAVAKALGLIGDRDAIGPLLALSANDNKTELTRAFASVALGIVGEKTDLPWNAAISEDNNYRARVPAIDEVLDIL